MKGLVFVVDDESKIRRFITMNLEDAGYDVCAASDGDHAVEAFVRMPEAPDIVVLDLMMPGRDGFEVLEEIRKRSAVPVIMLTAKADVSEKMRAFSLGADDYMTKPFAVEELLMRINAVLRRTKMHKAPKSEDAEMLNGPLVLHPDKREALWDGAKIQFSDVEYRLLQHLMNRPGAVMTHEELTFAVWDTDALEALNSLRVTVARIRRKFEAAGADVPIISSLSGVGYVLADLSDY